MADEQKIRENMFRRVVSRLGRGYHSFCADISTGPYECPQLVRVDGKAFRPDVTAYSGSQLHIYAVESARSIRQSASHDRWLALGAHASEEDECTFHLAVPAGSRDHARLWLKQFSIDADILTLPM